jgi:phosphoglycerate kinase
MVEETLRLTPIAFELNKLMDKQVIYLKDCIGKEVENAIARFNPGEIILLENLRFHAEEEENDQNFARTLASYADIYVNDAFGAAHRAHASITGVPKYLPAVAGFLMENEITNLGRVLDSNAYPLASISGGAKISDKMAALKNIVAKVSILLIGGGMAASFLKALGFQTGRSYVEEQGVECAKILLEMAGDKIILPIDVIVSDLFEEGANHRISSVENVAQQEYIVDIGPETSKNFETKLKDCKLIVWNGPMGVYEWESFSQGTRQMVKFLSTLSDVITIVGGGSTADAVRDLQLNSKFTHVSTGGGASLEFLEGKELPGIKTLLEK